jgi:hypothetical protein
MPKQMFSMKFQKSSDRVCHNKTKTIFKLLQAHANEVFNEIPKAVDPVACFAGLFSLFT